MSTDSNFLIPAVMALILGLIPGFFSLLKYALGVWAIRTAKSPAERKAQAEVAKKAVSSSATKGLVKLPGPRGKGSG